MKAFRVTIPRLDPDGEHPSIVYAETASKARYLRWLDISDIYMEIQIMDIRVLRQPGEDRFYQGKQIVHGSLT